MTLRIEPYDPARHAARALAQLIFDSDPQLNALVYGADAKGLAVIEKLLGAKDGYFDAAHIRCAVWDGEVAGVIVGYPVSQKEEVDNVSGQAFMKAMGAWQFLKRMPLFLRMAKLTGGEMDPAGYYIHTISVGPAHQRRGVGSRLIEAVSHGETALYLHVSDENDKALAFYERAGFQRKSHAAITLRGQPVGEYLMEKLI